MPLDLRALARVTNLAALARILKVSDQCARDPHVKEHRKVCGHIPARGSGALLRAGHGGRSTRGALPRCVLQRPRAVQIWFDEELQRGGSPVEEVDLRACMQAQCPRDWLLKRACACTRILLTLVNRSCCLWDGRFPGASACFPSTGTLASPRSKTSRELAKAFATKMQRCR